MTYLRPKVYGNFKQGKTKPARSAKSREGMSKSHLEFIRDLPSCLSLAGPCEAHHLLSAPGRGVGLKAVDRWALPLTPEEHRRLHDECTSKTEEEWFVSQAVMPHVLARQLWHMSGDHEAASLVIETHRRKLRP